MIENIVLFINALPIPVFIQDLNGVYLDCNDRFAIYLEADKNEIIGKTVNDIVVNKDLAQKAIGLNEQLIAKSEYAEGQYSWAGNSVANSYKDFVVNKSLLRDYDGNVFGIIGTITDLKNYKIFKEELVKTENIINQRGLDPEALRILNHEFRTPMNAIIGLTDLLYKTEEDYEKKGLLEKIKISNERLLKLIINILQLAEIESDEFDLDIKKINIVEIIKRSIENYKYKAQLKGLDLKFNYENDSPLELHTCSFAVTVILSNLLSNAIKYSIKGEVIVSLNHSIKNEKVIVEISVSDQGIGIPEKELKNIFKKYVKIEKEHEEFFDGAGLGLNIVKQIVEAMKGKIYTQSSIDVGTVFTVLFPVSL